MSRRQRNYDALKLAGFLPFEAREITRVTRITPYGRRIRVRPLPLKTPYIKDMIRERSKAFKKAKRLGFPKSEWVATIRDMYEDRGWLKDDGSPDVWQMVRSAEEQYKEKHPDYKSPERPRKRKDYRSHSAKYDAGLAKYPKGRIYK